MNTKLTLRMDKALVRTAKREARHRGKSVSRMVGEYIDSLRAQPASPENLPPVTKSLVGILRGRHGAETDYRKHLREKHL